jgi:hypothetical protein
VNGSDKIISKQQPSVTVPKGLTEGKSRVNGIGFLPADPRAAKERGRFIET